MRESLTTFRNGQIYDPILSRGLPLGVGICYARGKLTTELQSRDLALRGGLLIKEGRTITVKERPDRHQIEGTGPSQIFANGIANSHTI